MTKYRKKPVVISAFQFPYPFDEQDGSFEKWYLSNGLKDFFFDENGDMNIETLEGIMKAGPGDYIIKGIKGEFYPCKPDIFEATYEKA